jgi:uncharacterized phage-associated protein
MSNFENPTKAVLDVSAYIFKRLNKLGPVEAIKLQKLLYYCNAWSLADRSVPLFYDEIQAWKHGPVVASIYPLHRGEIDLTTWPHGSPEDLSTEDRELVDNIVDTYGGLSGWRLRNLTHQEKPWIDAWDKARQGKVLRVPIDPETTGDFYRGMRAQG